MAGDVDKMGDVSLVSLVCLVPGVPGDGADGLHLTLIHGGVKNVI